MRNNSYVNRKAISSITFNIDADLDDVNKKTITLSCIEVRRFHRYIDVNSGEMLDGTVKVERFTTIVLGQMASAIDIIMDSQDVISSYNYYHDLVSKPHYTKNEIKIKGKALSLLVEDMKTKL